MLRRLLINDHSPVTGERVGDVCVRMWVLASHPERRVVGAKDVLVISLLRTRPVCTNALKIRETLSGA